MYYLKSRYYDPGICRFINADDASFAGAGGEYVSYNLFAYCGDCPPQYSDHSGKKYVEQFSIKKYYVDGELRGFSVDNNELFLDPNYCLAFAEEYVEKEGEMGRFAGMTPERIALELYAHAELYYYALSIPDPLSISKNTYFAPINESSALGSAIVSWTKHYLIAKGKKITVDYDETAARMFVYQLIWENKTGTKYVED